MQWFAVLLAVGPCVFWLLAVLRHDDHEREPWGLVAIATLLGAAVPFGVLWSRPILVGWCDPLTLTVDAFVVTALAEELWKLLALLPLLLLRETDEPLDGAVYGAAVGLGFAMFENVWFVRATGDMWLPLQRAFTATLLHAACTGMLGIAWATAKLRARGCWRLGWMSLGLVVAVGVHGLYDLLLLRDGREALVALLGLLPAALALWYVKLRWARSFSERFHPRDGTLRR